MMNVIKMDLYRMVKQKISYILLVAMTAFLVFSVAMTAFLVFSVAMTKEDMAMTQTPMTAEQASEESMGNLGLYLNVPAASAQDVTVDLEVFSHMASRAPAIFTAIFAVIFLTADLQTGYIKNIAGQIEKRQWLIYSKAVVLAVYTAVSFIVTLITITLSCAVFFGKATISSFPKLMAYMGGEYMLYMAFGCIILCLAVIIRNHAVTVALAICLCMNIQLVLYGVINSLLGRAGVDGMNISEYTVSGWMSCLSLGASAGDMLRGIVTALIFGAAALTVAVIVFKQRDI